MKKSIIYTIILILLIIINIFIFINKKKEGFDSNSILNNYDMI